MKLWMRKIAVALVTIVTLGIYTPTDLLNIEAEDNKDNVASKADVNEAVSDSKEAEKIDFHVGTEDNVINQLTEKAKEQTIVKFGPKIAGQVEEEFNTVILPNIEAVIQTIVADHVVNDYSYFGITEQPAKGYGERIFNVYDHHLEQDIATFHVRRDNRPLEGHYFNFHYHLSSDGFKEHHDIGEIYWDKNTPPKWMA
ncbi:YpjP family protein [Oceanobacillus sp. CF4.6]|uniref:YpjP family protein n=1 Tax=Oceanobacillus sp. CF4.6 TaxID=3373080 RepID=UPI003EE6CFBF